MRVTGLIHRALAPAARAAVTSLRLIGITSAIVLFATRASAATVVVTYTGTVVADFGDVTGLLGPGDRVGNEYIGESYVTKFYLDVPNGDVSFNVADTGCSYCDFNAIYYKGGPQYPFDAVPPPSPITGETVTIGDSKIGFKTQAIPSVGIGYVTNIQNLGTSVSYQNDQVQYQSGPNATGIGYITSANIAINNINGQFIIPLIAGQPFSYSGPGVTGEQTILISGGYFGEVENDPPGIPNTGINGNVTSISVSGVSVPEPATWAMMILGLGAVGAILRWRREQGLVVA